MQCVRRPGSSQLRLALRLAGVGLLIAAGAIHLDLYLTGYRSIPVIGWLFLFQVTAAFVLTVVVLASGSRLAAAAAAGFAVATLGGYLLSVRIGLFRFRRDHTQVYTLLADKVADAEIRAARRPAGPVSELTGLTLSRLDAIACTW